MKNQITSLDEVLNKLSVFGKYHMQFMAFGMLTYLYGAMFSHNYIFAADESGYRCIDEDFNNHTCGSINGNQCSGWIYDNPNTFVAEFQLACQEWKRTLVGTIHSFGYMLGLLIVGPLSDKVGRKKALIWTGVTGAVIGVAKSFSHSYWLYVTLEFLGSLIGDNYSPFYVLNLEIVSAKKRVIFHFLCNAGSYIGGMILPLIAWGTSYWRYTLRAMYSPGFLFIFAFVILDESPRWLLTQKRKDKAIAVVKKMGYKNNFTFDKESLDRLKVEDETNSIKFFTLLKMTIQSRTLLKRLLVCIVWWITATFVYHGLMINTMSLQGNKFLNYGLSQLFQLPGNFVLMYILHNYRRRIPLICSFFTTALLCFVQPFLSIGYPWVSVMMYIASSMISSFYFDITYIYTLELFPTFTRNSMHSLCSSAGRIGGILAPQTPLLMAYWSGLPTLIFGGMSLAAGLVTFLVPDTANKSLPDTVREAEDIGNKRIHDVIGIDNLGIT